MPTGDEGNGWDQYQKLVLKQLEENRDSLKSLDKRVQRLALETATKLSSLNVKAGVWGLLSGLIPVTILLVVQLAMK